MSDEKERRCLTCKKLLLEDEKMPICLRCRLRGRNYAGKGGQIIGGLVIAAFGGKAAIDSTKSKQ